MVAVSRSLMASYLKPVARFTIRKGDQQDKITGMEEYGDNLYVFKRNSVFVIQKRAKSVEAVVSAPKSFMAYYILIGLVALLAAGSLALHFRKQR